MKENLEVTYICGQTKKKVVSTEGMPKGWVIPKHQLFDPDADPGPIPPKYSVIAFSSEKAMKDFLDEKLNK